MNQEILMDEPKQLLPVRDLEIRIVWLINLRWLAAIGLFLVLTGARYLLKMNLPFLMLYAGNLILILYNSLFFFIEILSGVSKGHTFLPVSRFPLI